MKESRSIANYPNLAGMLYNTPLMIHPEKAAIIEQVFRSHLNGEGITAEVTRDTENAFDVGCLVIREGYTTEKPYALTEGGTAIIPIVGALVHRMGWIDAMSGMLSYPRLAQRIRHAIDNSSVKGVLLEIDSPGGSVSGLFELADQIMSARTAKPIWSNSNESMFSAAYAIGSSTHRIYAPRTGMAGSIGVIAMHIDQSSYDEKRGVKYTPIIAGKHKADTSPHKPLGKDARERMQSIVDAIYAQFVGHVAAARNMTEEEVRNTEAQIFTASESVDNSLIDGIATLDETVAELESTYGSAGRVIVQSTRGTRITKQEESTMDPKEKTAADKSAETHVSNEVHQAAVDKARNEGIEAGKLDGAKAERDRIQAIEALAMPGHEELVNTLKYDGKTTGPEAAVQILNAERAKTRTVLTQQEQDATALSSVNTSVSAQGDQGQVVAAEGQPVTEETCKAKWDKDAKLRADFGGNYQHYLSFAKAQSSGNLRILKQRA